ncbi:1-acyl-sn-glycerol-3-phosphate acyltransferase [Candidatus Cyanaurora vandensis]|uniref:lysophospholipid acyltransferase family protein n=1 Tax=Candidatus Cyanaurora vandensis TaxID=2714958 RepID=UPI002580562B|nr:lysophospholipid acyltransferase family protein [Candidatus Cyanaurora vandensis]
MAYPPPESRLFIYHFSKWLLVSPLLHLAWRLKIEGQEYIPSSPYIAVCNHASNLDPLIIGNCLGRPTAFMAKEELFHVPVLKHIMRIYGSFPVKRGVMDRGALRSALEALAAGWVVGVFIQGTRTPDGRVDNPQPGAVLLAAKAGVPLLPVAILGSGDILPKGAVWPRIAPVAVRFAPTILPPPSTQRADLDRVNQVCTQAINRLLDRPYT